MILEATDLFRCNVTVWLLSETFERDYWYGTLHHLELKSKSFRILLMAGNNSF